MSTADSASSEYVLGSSPRELARLGLQARILDGFSEAFLRNAGIEPGMHVLDVGCGAGDLTFLVADLVGPSGRVVGVDSSSDAVSAARARSKKAGLTHVEFIQADLSTGPLQLPERAFDALVGRLVLYVFKDPVSVVHNLLKHVRPAGLVAFHERAALYGQGWPQTPLRQTVGRWLFELGRRSGVDLQFGLKPTECLSKLVCLPRSCSTIFALMAGRTHRITTGWRIRPEAYFRHSTDSE